MPMTDHRHDNGGRPSRRLAWFLALWLGSLAAFVLLAYVLRALLAAVL